MRCSHARRLFAAYWDDETTQAEREWLEGHFAACAACRTEYETYARTLELLGSLPRVEAAPDLADRALARARRAETAPDRLPAGRPQWMPLTATAAAVALLTLTLLGPWSGALRPSGTTAQRPAGVVTPQPVLVGAPQPVAYGLPSAGAVRPAEPLLAGGVPASDSLFDHSEDVEFVLDPVTLHRGRASVTRGTGAAQGERAVITF